MSGPRRCVSGVAPGRIATVRPARHDERAVGAPRGARAPASGSQEAGMSQSDLRDAPRCGRAERGGWGIGVGIHGYVTYRGDELSEERIRAEMNRIAGG